MTVNVAANPTPQEESGDGQTPHKVSERSFRVFATLLWAASTVPTTILLYQSGRVFGESTPYTPQTQALRYALLLVALLWALVIIYRGVKEFASRPLNVLLLLTFAVFFPAASAYFHGDGSVDEFFTAGVSTFIALALFSVKLSVESLSVVGALGALTGAVSLAMAQVRPDSAYAIEQGGRALAGPFNNSNYLGTVLVLSLPFAFLIRKRILRLGAIGLIVFPILLGGSNTGIATLAAFAAVGLVILAVRAAPSKKSLLTVATCVAGIGMVTLPLSVQDPTSLTSRGAIWMYSRSHSSEYLPFGAGRGWFQENGMNIGFEARHAHHLLLDPLIVGGVPYAGAILALLLLLVTFGLRTTGRGGSVAPGMFALILILAGGLGNFFILDLRDLRYPATGFVIVALLSIATRAGSPTLDMGQQRHR